MRDVRTYQINTAAAPTSRAVLSCGSVHATYTASGSVVPIATQRAGTDVALVLTAAGVGVHADTVGHPVIEVALVPRTARLEVHAVPVWLAGDELPALGARVLRPDGPRREQTRRL